jgi:S1-C subfamily serine protease
MIKYITVIFLVLASSNVTAQDIEQQIYQKTMDDFMPAICKVSYAMEIRNNNSGEMTRRNATAIGLIVSEDGIIMTHGHMHLDNRKPLSIKIKIGQGDDEKEYEAVALKKPDDINVFFLQIETDEDIKFPYLKFDADGAAKIGEPLLSVGLLGPSLDYEAALQAQRVGAILEDPRLTYCLDRPISFGYIGGPAINQTGDIVGVLGFELSNNEGGDIYNRSGQPMMFQAGLFQKYIDSPPSKESLSGDNDDAWLGVYTQPLTDDFAEYWDLPNDGGVIISTVIAGSPAQRSGLRSGDVMTLFNDHEITAKQPQDISVFTKMVRESPLDQPLSLTLYRDGKIMDMALTLTKRPTAGADAAEFEDKIFGITARELTTDVRIGLNLADDVQGVIIRTVKSGSAAAVARLRPNYVVMSFGGIAISNLEDFQNAVQTISKEKPEEITVFCRVGANTAFFRMQPRWND